MGVGETREKGVHRRASSDLTTDGTDGTDETDGNVRLVSYAAPNPGLVSIVGPIVTLGLA